MGFRSQFGNLVEFEQRWRGAVDTYLVYSREAFPSESRWPAPTPDGKPASDPTTLPERLENARRFQTHVGDQVTVLVDSLADTAVTSYDAYPFRVYLLDAGGNVALPSAKGAVGFAQTLERIESWLNDRHLNR